MQKRMGYRFSIDAILLAAAVAPKPQDKVLDLGTGCGIVPLILARRFPEIQIQGVEIQTELAELACQNVTANKMENHIRIVQADMCALPQGPVTGPFDWIVSNPPYHGACSGRLNPDSQKALARHEIMMDLAQLTDVARRLLRTGGRFMTIYAAERLADLLVQLRCAGIEPKWIRSIHSHCEEDARLILVMGIKGARPGTHFAAPLVIYHADGRYTAAVEAMMR